ncbi:MAG: ATP-binding protein [Bacilli bacterium]|nr:ATP-binding protein [Bacilli bacterium]
MIGKIFSIEENYVMVELTIDISNQANLINVHVVFEDGNIKVVGEILNINKNIAKIGVVGEIVNNSFIPGINKKPSFRAKVRIVVMDELALILGEQTIKDNSQVYLGLSNVYTNYHINVGVNDFFSNHFSILGNTGSGKSSTTARILQNVFGGGTYIPVKARIFLFDAYGEYVRAFSELNKISDALCAKVLTTNIDDSQNEILRIPVWTLDVDDLAILLEANEGSQLSIIERALKYTPILKESNAEARKFKNDIIARAILDILRSGNDSSKIRDQVTAILTTYNTSDLNLETPIVQPGYNRTLKQCLFVDNTGKMSEMELVVDCIYSFIVDGIEIPDNRGDTFYTLRDLELAMNFALISEGILKSDKVYDYANVLQVRLHSLINSDASIYFDYPKMISRAQYIDNLSKTMEGKRAQIIDININYVNDRLAKSITKIISRMIFENSCSDNNRGKHPNHIIIEEAHRYVQKDNDVNLLGYNIFERISKEGRKYGVILGLITQRPSELSETCISQCANFIILRTIHPKDLEYINEMVPNINEECTKQLKTLQPGHALAFGSAFKVPVEIKFEKPNPEPLSNNSDIVSAWFG